MFRISKYFPHADKKMHFFLFFNKSTMKCIYLMMLKCCGDPLRGLNYFGPFKLVWQLCYEKYWENHSECICDCVRHQRQQKANRWQRWMMNEWWMDDDGLDSHSSLLICSPLSGQRRDSLGPRDGLNMGWLYLLIVKWTAELLLPTSHTALAPLDPRCGAAEPPRPPDPWPVHSSIRY